ncbi:MAG: cardiolipin synthase [Clostridia bacterium]|nr:cardiolipin synthase [Clostridia bacterium]
MKRIYRYKAGKREIVNEINYIPVRYIIAMMITVFEILTVIGAVVALCYFVPYFYILAWATEIGCVIKIIASEDNPDYKIPWLLFVLILPIGGFMLYLMFYSRKLKKKYIRRLDELQEYKAIKEDTDVLCRLESEDPTAHGQARMLCNISDSHIFECVKTEYFTLGEHMYASMLKDLKKAEKFIFLEFFIVEEGKFWDSVLEILKEKAKNGVDVRVLYDDIGCMKTLPGNYAKILGKYGIKATPFSRLRGQLDNEFNNRSHRKIMVIDGYIGYTGGVNIADEYINEVKRFGHWKDVGIRLEGEAVWGLTELFLTDFGINYKSIIETENNLYPVHRMEDNGYVVPFGDGPKPLYIRNVGKSVIENILASSTSYVYITTPYLIIDNELCTALENTALRGVDVRIVTPHIPDKKLVFSMTRSFYLRLIRAGVKIYEYTPGFIHAKTIVSDDKYAVVSTINLDYRSLVHHFENGVWLYKCDCIRDIYNDINATIDKSELIKIENLKTGLIARFVRSLIRIFAPLL